MSTDDRPTPVAQRKALLVSRSELERLQIAVLVNALRERISPPRLERDRSGKSRPRAGTVAAALVGVGLPLLGRKRLSGWLRTGSLAMTAWRVFRQWRSGLRD